MIVVFCGSIGRFPVGGHAWINMQYLIGLRELGHEVYYVEECGEESWVYNWETQELTTDLDYPASYVRACMDLAGLPDRWIYRAGELDRSAEIHVIAPDGRLVPRPAWNDHPMVTVAGGRRPPR